VICVDPPTCSTDYEPQLKIGDVGITGPTFLDNAEYRLDVVNQFALGGYVVESVDMESGAIAHVAETNGKPYLAIRSMSDLAGGEASFDQISQFLNVAAQNSVFVLLSLMEEIEDTIPSGHLWTGTQAPQRCKH